MNIKTIFSLCLATLLLQPISTRAASEDLRDLQFNDNTKGKWRMTKDDKRHQIKVFVKNEDGNKLRFYRVEAILNAPIETVARVQADVDNYSKWYFGVLEVKLLKRISDKEYIFYMVHDAPIGTPDRDVILHTVIEPMSQTRRYVMIRTTSIPDYLPPQAPYVRMEAENAITKWTPISKDKTLVESEGFIDPGGTAPAWAINYVQGKGPYASFLGVQRMIRLPQYNDSQTPIPYTFFE